MVTLFVLSLTAAGLISATLYLRKASESQVRAQIAHAVAQGFVEQARAVPFADLVRIVRDGEELVLSIESGRDITVAINAANPTRVMIPVETVMGDNGEIISERRMPLDFSVDVNFTRNLGEIIPPPSAANLAFGAVITVRFSWENALTRQFRSGQFTVFRSSVD